MKDDITTNDTPVVDDVKPPIPDATSTGAEFSDDYGPEPFPSKDTQAAMKQHDDNSHEKPAEPPELPSRPAPEVKDPSLPNTNEENQQQAAPQDQQSVAEISSPPPPEQPSDNSDETKRTEVAQSSSEVAAPAIHDHGTHRSTPRSGNKAMAITVGIVGLILCGLVVFIYIATN